MTRFSAVSSLALATVLMAIPHFAQAQVAQDPAGETVLDEIVVTASTRAQTVEQAPASIAVVTGEQLEQRAYVDLFDAVRDVEGVAISGGSNFQDILIRGLPGNYTLMLVDGRRLSTREARVNGSGGVEQAFLPPVGAIERIEVVRGPMSSLYGTDALGGVINVITKKVPDRWGGSVGGDVVLQEGDVSGNWEQGRFYLAGPIVDDRFGGQIWGRSYSRAEDRKFDGAGRAGQAGSRDNSLTGRLAWTPNADHEILLQGDVMRIDRRATPGRTLAANGRETRNDHARDAVSAAWNGGWSWGSSALSVLRETATRETFVADATGVLVRSPRAPEITNTVYDALFDVPFEGSRLGDHHLVFGAQAIDNALQDINPGARDNVRREYGVTQSAVFAENEWRIRPDLRLTLGLRYDDHPRYGGHWSPRAYLVWNADPTLTVKGGVSTGFRAPELRAVIDGYAYETGGANCNYGAGQCGVIIGDPDLKPETSVNYELAGLWRPLPSLRLSATAFRTDFEDRIDSDRACGPDANSNGVCDPAEFLRWDQDRLYQLFYWYNLTGARIQGVELSGRWAATDRLSLGGGYTYTDSTQKGGLYDGLPLSRTPEHLANLRIDLQATEALSLWTAAIHRGEEINAGLRVGVNGQPILDGARQVGRRYPSHTLVDMGAVLRIGGGVALKAGVYNVTDEVLDVAQYDFQGEGRRYWLGLDWTF